MRRFLVRDVNLLFPFGVVVAMGVLAGFGWQLSVSTQRSREAAQQLATEGRLLDLVAHSVGEVEREQLDYLLSGDQADLLGYQAALASTDAWAARLGRYSVHDPAFGKTLREFVKLVEARQAVLSHEVDLRRTGASVASLLAERTGPDMPQARQVQDHLLAAEQMLEGKRQKCLDVVTGRIRTLRWLAAAVAALGVVGVLSVFRLLSRAWRRLIRAETQQRMIAMQLRGSLDSLSQGVAVFGMDGRLLNWNMRLGQILDLPPALLRRGLPYDELEAHLAAEGAGFLEPLTAILADAPGSGVLRPVVYERVVRQHADAGFDARRADSDETQIEIRRTLMPQGGFVLTLTDMTERAHAQRMLHEAQKMQALGQLTGGIAHDFNNLLAVIVGSLDVPQAELAAAGDGKVALLTMRMRQAAQAAESGAALTRRLLAFARKQPLAPRAVDLRTILPELVPLLRHTLGESIAVSFSAEPVLWPAVADAAQLESAVLNLALNARDAMPDGGRVVIEAGNAAFGPRRPTPHPDLLDGEYVRIAVSDTGHGMSREVIERAFEPFFSTKSEGRGTGLGLAMVFGFARQSGGLATIHSEPGSGTTVTLYLPRAVAGVAEIHDAPEPQPDQRVETSELRVLLVEDDDSVREVAAGVLRELGYRVSEAPDAERALQLLDSRKDLAEGGLSLLLTDITLPGAFDGRALAARVRQKSPATRVLYISGHLEDGPSADADAHVQWLGKPFRRAQLASKVDALIGVPCTGEAA